MQIFCHFFIKGNFQISLSFVRVTTMCKERVSRKIGLEMGEIWGKILLNVKKLEKNFKSLENYKKKIKFELLIILTNEF